MNTEITAKKLQEGESLTVFPIPPEKQFRIMALVRSIIYRASKYVQQAAINRLPDKNAMFPIQQFWIPLLQRINGVNTEIPKIERNAFTNTWNGT